MTATSKAAQQIVEALKAQPDLLSEVYGLLHNHVMPPPRVETGKSIDPVFEAVRLEQELKEIREKMVAIKSRYKQPTESSTTESSITESSIDDLFKSIPDDVKPKPNPEGYYPTKTRR